MNNNADQKMITKLLTGRDKILRLRSIEIGLKLNQININYFILIFYQKVKST
jgi:hypothetical protein